MVEAFPDIILLLIVLSNIFIYWLYFQIIQLYYKIEEFIRHAYFMILSYILLIRTQESYFDFGDRNL
jgi:hypothetical protein